MNICFLGKEINNLLRFTSNNPHRHILHCINFKKVNGKLEVAATDGAVLAVYSRELTNNEEMADDESFFINLKNFKFKDSDLVFIIKQNDNYYIRNTGSQDVMIKPYEGYFPKYNEVIYTGEEKANSYVKLDWKYLKIIHKVIGGKIYNTPFQAPKKDSRFSFNTNPCVWRDEKWTIALMPVFAGD